MNRFPVLPPSVDTTLFCSSRDLLLSEASFRALFQNCFPREGTFEFSVLVDGWASWDMFGPAVVVSIWPPDAVSSVSAVEGRVSCSNDWLENENSSLEFDVKLSLISSGVELLGSPKSFVSSSTWDKVLCSRDVWLLKLSLASSGVVLLGSSDSFVSSSAWDEVLCWREFWLPRWDMSPSLFAEKPLLSRPWLRFGSCRFCEKRKKKRKERKEKGRRKEENK